MLKISVITWDGNFRESDHTIRSFGDQNFKNNEYELIWVDFYQSNNQIKETISQYSNAKLLTLNHPYDEPWHLGLCINAGVELSLGELLVIPDGDIAVDRNILQYIWDSHQYHRDLALYFQRYDEIGETRVKERIAFSYLEKNCRLTNPENYSGCLTLSRYNFENVNGYETHSAFAGSGCQAIELYTRLRNSGMAIKWSPDKKVYHPWHQGSGEPMQDDRKTLRMARYRYSWIIPYSGLEQSWIVNCRNFSGSRVADILECEKFLETIPVVDLNYYSSLVSLNNGGIVDKKKLLSRAKRRFSNFIYSNNKRK
ncbi:MAG: glycosyltransferase family A protein [Pseudomonadota bacterium]